MSAAGLTPEKRETSFTTAKMATNPANLPYHPGALRYYKEKGLVK